MDTIGKVEFVKVKNFFILIREPAPEFAKGKSARLA